MDRGWAGDCNHPVPIFFLIWESFKKDLCKPIWFKSHICRGYLREKNISKMWNLCNDSPDIVLFRGNNFRWDNANPICLTAFTRLSTRLLTRCPSALKITHLLIPQPCPSIPNGSWLSLVCKACQSDVQRQGTAVTHSYWVLVPEVDSQRVWHFLNCHNSGHPPLLWSAIAECVLPENKINEYSYFFIRIRLSLVMVTSLTWIDYEWRFPGVHYV